MRFSYNKLVRFGWFYGPDESGGGGVQTSADPASNPASNPTPNPGTIPPTATSPATVSMTAEEFESAMAKASAKALADAEAKQEAHKREMEAREAELRRRQASSQLNNPQMDALEAMDLRSDMLEEALALHSDMPLEARQQLKEDLRSFRTVDQVRAAKDSGLHIKLADAAAGSAIRSGKYTPKNLSTPQVTREPAHSEPASGKVPDSYRREMEAEFASMGLKLTEKELAEAYAADQR